MFNSSIFAGHCRRFPHIFPHGEKKIKIVIQIFSDLCYYIGGEFAMCGRQQCALPRVNGIMHQKIHNTEEIMHFNDIINAVLNGLAEFRFQDFIDIVIIP